MSKPELTPAEFMVPNPDFVRAGIKARKEHRTLVIDITMEDVAIKLSSNPATFDAEMVQAALFINSADSYIASFIRSGVASGLINYIEDTATITTYPFLGFEYVVGQTIGQYIVSKLS